MTVLVGVGVVVEVRVGWDAGVSAIAVVVGWDVGISAIAPDGTEFTGFPLDVSLSFPSAKFCLVGNKLEVSGTFCPDISLSFPSGVSLPEVVFISEGVFVT
ncbi:MAG TPA: hypothetical protein DEG17_04755, partial [Cyanobacteria bacterium UBA11149]|nr:hypothetical protein [Cyanobacteria bacterium UBA11367]HBW88198.1 hypothetical protein [Cyanobacteria bacterium UBA11149]